MVWMVHKGHLIEKLPHDTKGKMKHLFNHIVFGALFISVLLFLADSGDKFSLGASIWGGY
jgi:hypothetical protein